MRPQTFAILIGHAVVGWVLCGLTIAGGMAVLPTRTALIVHAVAAPLYFAVIAGLYFRRFHFTGALATALAFTALVMFLDATVVALLIVRDFAMFASVLGTWLPFLLIFLVTWTTGRLVHPAR